MFMKKFFSLLMSVAVLFSVTSCSQEDITTSIADGNEVLVTLTTTLASVDTRAVYGNGDNVDKLIYNVYDAQNGDLLTNLSGTAPATTPGKFTVQLKMLKGMKYNFVFWAQNKDCEAYTVNEDKTVKVDYTKIAANDDKADAFFGYVPNFDPVTATSTTFKLYRPFAQLNAATTDYDVLTDSGVTNLTSTVTLKTYNTFDISTGDVTDNVVDVTFKEATDIPTVAFHKPGYTYLSMNYVLAAKNQNITNTHFTFTGKKSGNDVVIAGTSYANIPLQQNFRTNILGALLTKTTDFTVEIVPAFDNTEHDELIEEVKNVSELNTKVSGLTGTVNKSYVVEEQLPVGDNTIVVPDNVTDGVLSFDFDSVEDHATNDTNLTINAPDAYTGEIKISTAENENIDNLVVNAPNATVTVNGELYTSVTASTGENTLIVPEGTVIETLTINKGNVVIYGTVNNIVEGDGYTGTITQYVGTAESLVAAFASPYVDAIVVNANITTAENTKLSVKNGSVLSLDLNGYTITAVDTQTASYGLITNNGDLTIKSSKAGGKITLSATQDRGWNAYSSVLSNSVGGNLTVLGGTFEHTGGTDMAYALDNLTNGKGTQAVAVIEDGELISSYRAIRQFANGIEATNDVTIKNGLIKGTSNAIWIQNPSDKNNSASLTVTGGTYDGGIYVDKTCTNVTSNDITASISNATLVVSREDCLADAVNYAVGNVNVVLGTDITLVNQKTVNIADNTAVTLDLNGYDLTSAVDNSGKAAAIFNIKPTGILNVVNNATAESKITFKASDPDLQEIPAYATNTISNDGTLTIGAKVVVENHSYGGASYAIDNRGKFTLNGGTLLGNRCALRIAKYNQDDVQFTMNGGLVQAQTPAWIQLPNNNANVAPKITVEINDGTFQSTKESSADNNVLYTYSYGNSHANTKITINGGKFLGGTVSIGSGYKGDAPTLNITGGTFEYDVLQWLEGDTYNVLYKANK